MKSDKPAQLTCILCPLGCALEIKKRAGSYLITGHQCKRGKEYALSELTNPQRTLTTTVKTIHKDFPRLPVKTDKDIPLKEIFQFMREINRVVVKKRLKPGDIVLKRMLGTEINLVAGADMRGENPGTEGGRHEDRRVLS